MSNQAHANAEQPAEEETKMLGALVPKSLYWHFKTAAAQRNEDLKVAMAHAARMYIDAVPKAAQAPIITDGGKST